MFHQLDRWLSRMASKDSLSTRDAMALTLHDVMRLTTPYPHALPTSDLTDSSRDVDARPCFAAEKSKAFPLTQRAATTSCTERSFRE